MTFKQLLIDMRACEEAREWAGNMPIEKVVEKCHRGDWLLWLAQKVGVDKRKLTLAKGHCANTVRHLMRDDRSIKAVDIAIAYGIGRATDKELKSAADAAFDASYAYDAYAEPAAAAADAAYSAAADAYDAAAAADAADAAYSAAANAAADTHRQNRKRTADICRKYIGNEIVEQVKIMCNDTISV